jgi:hypothetical protein
MDRLLIDVALLAALGFRERLLLEARRGDEAVAPEAAAAREHQPVDAEDVDNLSARLVEGHFGAHLGARDEVLVDEGVEHQPGTHGVRGQEEEVAVGKALGHGVVGDVARDRLAVDPVVRLAGHTRADGGLPPGEALAELADARAPVGRREPCHRVPAATAHDPGEVRQLDALRVAAESSPREPTADFPGVGILVIAAGVVILAFYVAPAIVRAIRGKRALTFAHDGAVTEPAPFLATAADDNTRAHTGPNGGDVDAAT